MQPTHNNKQRIRASLPTLAATAGLMVGMGLLGTEAAHAEEVNVPGIIAGAVDGNVPGIAGSAAGHSYWGQSGYYAGSRDRDLDARYFDRRDAYYRGQPYGDRYYDNRYYDNRYTRPAEPYRPANRNNVSRQWLVPANPPVSADPYRAEIVNPETNKSTLRFTINSRWYELKPGERQVFEGRMPRVIAFDRGGGKDLVRYSLSDGRYTFTPTEKGWELYRRELEENAQASTHEAETP